MRSQYYLTGSGRGEVLWETLGVDEVQQSPGHLVREPEEDCLQISLICVDLLRAQNRLVDRKLLP